jgi:hypothetical protein
MILHWDQLVLHYGNQIRTHRRRFETAGQTTYGLLCCKYVPSDSQLTYSSVDHAEERLLESESWQAQIPDALEAWTPRSNTIVVTMVINRSPCRSCTAQLSRALRNLHRRFPVKCDLNRFVLAVRGAYEDSEMVAATTFNDLLRLRGAGWELCALQVGHELSDRGNILREGIERITGRGFVRLG